MFATASFNLTFIGCVSGTSLPILYSNSAALLTFVRSETAANDVVAAVELRNVLRLIRKFIGTPPPVMLS
jgi:hypothetical protein